MSSLSRQQLVMFINGINIADKIVLDAGAGPNRYHATSWAKGEPAVYHTLDINPEFEPTYQLDLNELHEPGAAWRATPKTNHYQTIFCLETFEHLYDPLTALRNLTNWLEPGGRLIFSNPFINPIHDTHDYLRLTGEWWEKVLNKLEYSQIDIKPRIATDGEANLYQFFRVEGLRMSKIRLEKGEGAKLNHIGYMGTAIKK